MRIGLISKQEQHDLLIASARRAASMAHINSPERMDLTLLVASQVWTMGWQYEVVALLMATGVDGIHVHEAYGGEVGLAYDLLVSGNGTIRNRIALAVELAIGATGQTIEWVLND